MAKFRLVESCPADRAARLLEFLLERTGDTSVHLNPDVSILLREFALSWNPTLSVSDLMIALVKMRKESLIDQCISKAMLREKESGGEAPTVGSSHVAATGFVPAFRTPAPNTSSVRPGRRASRWRASP
jgi:hypothetical protein